MTKIKILIILLLIAITARATTYYVNSSSKVNNTGNSWLFAGNNLQEMLGKVSSGDTILVSTGIYNGGFVMREGITVMGGYVIQQAQGNLNVTRILPANATNDSQRSILDGNNLQTTLIQIGDFTTPTVWEGFVIRNGVSIASNADVGSFVFDKNGKDIIGIIYQFDGEHGKMLSLAETKKAWGGYQIDFDELPYIGNPENDANGEEFTNVIIESFSKLGVDNYAAAWCRTLTTESFNKWYLPSAFDWKDIYAAKSRISNVLTSTNTRLSNGYWTSAHAGDLLAWTFYFENGKPVPTLKYIEKKVRAVHSFHKNELTINSSESSIFLQENGVLKNCIVDGKEYNITSQYENKNTDFIIFPNPVRCGQNITVSTGKKGILQIIDISGKIIFSTYIDGMSTKINAPEIAGIYILRLENGKIAKIIVN